MVRAALLGISTLLFVGAQAQDIHFSQFRETPLLTNPANAGFYNGYERVVLNHKSQWVALGSPYRTTNASFDLPFFFGRKNAAHLGAGVAFYNDRAGDSQFGINKGSLSISGILPLGRNNKIATGIHLGMAQRSGQLDNLVWGSQFDGDGFNTDIPSNEANSLNSFGYADIGVGVKYEFDNTNEKLDGYDHFRVSAGVALFHANRPVLRYTNSTSDVLFRKFVGHLQVRWDIPGSSVSIMPQAMYTVQGPHSEMLIGSFVRFQLSNGTKFTGLSSENSLNLGLQVRGKDAVIPMVMVEFSDYAISVSYDISTSSIGTLNSAAGGFELTLRYTNVTDALWKRRTGY